MTLQMHEETISGGTGDLMHVRHLKLRGSNAEIGHTLGKLAQERHHLLKTAWLSPQDVAAQIEYLSVHAPHLLQQAYGCAEAYGSTCDQDVLDFTALNYNSIFPACSAVFYPGARSEKGHPFLSRNFDFSTGAMNGAAVINGNKPAAAEPYLMEVYPDKGYAALYMCVFDLMAAVDGVNSAGLAISMHADVETLQSGRIQPTLRQSVGMNEIQLVRLLLDRCATLEEVQRLLRQTRQYVMFSPCHYLIADRSGRSMIYEHPLTRGGPAFVPGGDQPQVMTNHLVHLHPDPDDLPIESFAAGSFYRYQMLQRAVSSHPAPFSVAEMTAINQQVFIQDTGFPTPQPVPDRTLWHALYDLEARCVSISFHLSDQGDPAADGQKEVRSPYLSFQLSI